YLAAAAYAERDWEEIAGDVDRYYAMLPEFEEFVVFLGGAFATLKHDGKAVRLVGLLSESDRDDAYRHRLALAARVLAEVPPAVRAPGSALHAWADRVTQELFSFWWRHAVKHTSEAIAHIQLVLPALGLINGRVEIDDLCAL